MLCLSRCLAATIFISSLAQAGVIYQNTTSDLGTSTILSDQLPTAYTVLGDQVFFSVAGANLAYATIGTYNATANDVTADATLNLYAVDNTDPNSPILGANLGTFVLPNFVFLTNQLQLITFDLGGLPVTGQDLVWTITFSANGLGLNQFDPPTIGSSNADTFWYSIGGPLTFSNLPASGIYNYQAEFAQVPEPTTYALTAAALLLLAMRRRKSLLLLLPAALLAKTNPQVPANDWAQIKAEYERHRHSIIDTHADNPNQNWTTQFTTNGFELQPKDATWRWGLELEGQGTPTRTTNVKNTRRHYHNGLEHWFENTPQGLEQGWTVLTPTQHLELSLKITGNLTTKLEGQTVNFYQGTERILQYTALRAWDANNQPLPATFTLNNNHLKLQVNTTNAQFPVTIDPIAQQAYLKASNIGLNDQFGYSVAISGDTIIVGAPNEDSNSLTDPTNNSASNSGAAYVFTRTAGSWTQQAYLKASNISVSDQFGWSVAISGDTIVVGVPNEDSNSPTDQTDNSAGDSGAAYVFTRTAGSWTQQAYLKASNIETIDFFGWSVAISGDTIVVGARFEDSNSPTEQGNNSADGSGAAYVFTRAAGSWTQQAYLKASNIGVSDQFGWSVAISGDTIFVGAPFEDSNSSTNQSDNSSDDSGAAYVFTRTAGSWTQQAYLKASNIGASDRFGWSVSISGDTILVGAINEDSNSPTDQNNNSASNSGAAYVFTRTAGSWTQQAYLKASNIGVSDQFGGSVAISGDTIVVGATNEASNSPTDQSDNSASSSGAAYVFARTAGSWTQQAYLKASNIGGSDFFGRSVSISSDTLVVGAHLEDSNSASDQSNNSASDSGAAYVFTITPDTAPVTITSNPTNLLFSTTGTGCAPAANQLTPQLANWTIGAACNVTFGTPQSGGPQTQYVFQQWEDSSTNPNRNITAPGTATTYTATFGTQHLLTVTANPPSGGTVTPAAATFFNANSVQPITATPTGCYAFSNWSGATVTANTVTMATPINVTANFTLPTTITVTKGPINAVRGIANRYRQTLTITNPLATAADVSIGLSSFGPSASLHSTPTGTSTTCLPPASSPYFTLTAVPANTTRSINIDFNAPSAAALTYATTAIAGPGAR